MVIYEVVQALNKYRLNYAIVGGYALALHGLVRATIDVDLVLSLKLADFEFAELALAEIGLQSRLPIRAQDVIKMRREYIENRNLLAWSFGGKKITVISLKELLKMKVKAGRPQDLVDAKNIKEKLNEKKG